MVQTLSSFQRRLAYPENYGCSADNLRLHKLRKLASTNMVVLGVAYSVRIIHKH